MRIGSREFDTEHHTYIMGILNVTPDSFSDGGKYNDLDKALLHAQELVRDGADILDVGGESTRPGHIQITEEEETERVVPVIERLKQEFDTPISIDTYKSSVAKAAVQAGAALVNDVWGLKYDAGMADVIAESQTACCLMHNREKAKYVNFLPEVLMDLQESVDIARKAGIAKDKIILDPGVGFGKTYEIPGVPYFAGNLQKVRNRPDTGSAGRTAGRGNPRNHRAWDTKRVRLCASARCEGKQTGYSDDRSHYEGT